MKRVIIALAAMLFAASATMAQTDPRILNHLSVGANVGTMGIGADVAMPLTRFLDIEAGFAMLPRIKFNSDANLNISSQYYQGPTNFDIQGKTNMVNGKLIFNVMPIPVFRTFHVSVGAYFGNGGIIDIYNKEEGALMAVNNANSQIRAWNEAHPGDQKELLGLKVGDYLLEPDANGNIDASASVNKFKPYVGLGFGKTVPNRRVGFKCDLGCVFWGSPSLNCNGVDLTKSNLDGDGGAIKFISKLKVYPVLNFRICGRIF